MGESQLGDNQLDDASRQLSDSVPVYFILSFVNRNSPLTLNLNKQTASDNVSVL